MKTPLFMQYSRNVMLAWPGFARAASKHLVALVLCALVLPGSLLAQTLQHRYSFVSDASDSVGTANGTLVPPNGGTAATITNGLTLPGGGGPGFSGYVTLPAGILLSTTNLTIECWATQNSQDGWAELWNFNNGTGQYIGYIPFPANNNNNMSLAIKNGNEYDAFSGIQLPTSSQQYIAATFNAATLTGNLYQNATLVASVTVPNNTYIPGTFGAGGGGTLNNYLGQDPWPDPQFQGTIYEFRIWNGVVSQRYLAASAVAGPSVLITNLTPTSVTVSAGPSVIITGTEQAGVTVQLAQTGSSNIVATSDATNWVSSNPSVLTVSTNGIITGVSVGTAKVSATVGGTAGTSALITVTGPPALLHRYSFVSDASDSVGGPSWDGTLVAPTGGTAATIANGLTLPGGGGPGFSGYVTLPSGILTNTTSVTVESWVTQSSQNTWAQIWNFNNNGSQNFGLIPYPANNANNLESDVTPNGNEQDIQSALRFPTNSEQHVAVVFNSSTLVGTIYDNGVSVASHTFPNRFYIPGSIGGAAGTANNVLGQDPFPDPQFQGTIYELRIWNGALSPVYAAVAAAAGPSVIVTNLTPSAVSVTVTNTSMIGAQVQPATVTGNFVDANNVTVTGGATNWTSSNPNVLTVNSSGLITAQSGGTATISATVDGVTATTPTITVADTAPTLQQRPANLTVAVGDPANFSVGALGGGLNYQWSFGATPIAGATNATLTIANVAFANAGTYSVRVSNNIGTTNASATLTVVNSYLTHRYSFVSDASDSVGGPAWNGTIVAPNGGSPASISNGLNLPGGGGPGFSGYVSLPAGILTNTHSLTVECWVTQNAQDTWAEIWSFNNGTSEYIGLIPYPANNNNNMSFAVRNGTEYDAFSPIQFPVASEQYVAATFDASSLTGRLYTNGTLIAAVTVPDSTYIPGNYGAGAGGTLNNVLGQDPFPDPQFQGTIYEFRIWDGVVSPLYMAISAAAGPSVLVTNLTPTSVSVAVTNTSMIGGQTQPGTAMANFANANGVDVTVEATNWTSSNPNVLTVNSSGVITAVSNGTATVSATLNGVTGSSPAITVQASAPILTQQPEASETLLVGATLRASVANDGTPPFVYFWFTNSSTTPISISTSPTLIVPHVQLASAANYSCLVSNQYGTASSSPLALTVVAPTAFQQTILSYGPLAYWPLDESSGTNAYDVIGGYNGTYNNGFSLGNPGPTNAFFASSTAAGFDGASAYVDIPEGPFNITNAITTMAWVQLTTLNGFDGLFGHGDSSWRMSVNGSGDPGANDGGAQADASSPFGISDANWHMVAYTYNGFVGQANNGALYVDGVRVANNTITAAPAGNNLDVWIGGAPDYGLGTQKRLIAGNIANVAIFTEGFTAAQIQGLYQGTFVAEPNILSIANTPSGIVLNWQEGTLLQAPTVHGPWTPNYSAVPPYTVPATNQNLFFKLLLNP